MATTEKQIKKVMSQIEKSKAIMAKERDKLRELESELATVLESWDSGIESFEIAINELKSGIESISELV